MVTFWTKLLWVTSSSCFGVYTCSFLLTPLSHLLPPCHSEKGGWSHYLIGLWSGWTRRYSAISLYIYVSILYSQCQTGGPFTHKLFQLTWLITSHRIIFCVGSRIFFHCQWTWTWGIISVLIWLLAWWRWFIYDSIFFLYYLIKC